MAKIGNFLKDVALYDNDTEVLCKIIAAGIKDVKANPHNKYVWANFLTTDNKVITAMWNIVNSSAAAERIAKGKFQQLAQACRLTYPLDDTDELIDKLVYMVIGTEEGRNGFPTKNVPNFFNKVPANTKFKLASDDADEDEDEQEGLF